MFIQPHLYQNILQLLYPVRKFNFVNLFFNVLVDYPNHLRAEFHGPWSSLNVWEPSKSHSMTGGLASPPESRFNSPILPFGSSSASQRGNLSPSQCVNPRDLHDEEPSPSAAGGEVPGVISSNDINNDKDATTYGLQTSPHSREDYPESHPTGEVESPGLISSKCNNNDEDTAMVDVQSSSNPQAEYPESSPPTGKVETPGLISSKCNDDDEDTAMVDVQSSSDPQADYPESSPPTGEVEKPALISLKCNGKGEDAEMVDSQSPSQPPEDDATIGVPPPMELLAQEDDVESRGSPRGEVKCDERLGPLSDLSDLSDGEDEGKPENVRKSSQPLGSKEPSKVVRPDVGTADPILQNVAKSNQKSSDFQYSLQLAAQFEPRRSSRNIPAKNRFTVNYVDYVPRRKSLSVKKKPGFEKDEIDLQASPPFFPTNRGN